MSYKFPDYLKPTMVEGISGFHLCSYLIALEGWKRGLTLKFHNTLSTDAPDIPRTKWIKSFGKLSSLSDGENTHYSFQSRGDSTSREAHDIAMKKELTKKYLIQNKIPILNGVSFTKQDKNETIIEAANKIGYPVIIKPTNGSLSKGVVIDIKNDQELHNTLIDVRENLGYKNFILETYFHGEDVRTYVVDNKVVAALRRVPAQVTGDGFHTIHELIQLKNEARKDNPYLSARNIKINKETREILLKQGYKPNDILESDKTIRVKNKSTLT